MAPEVIKLQGATTASDIWSLGCTIIELLTGNPPFGDLAPMAALFAMVKEVHPPFPPNSSPVSILIFLIYKLSEVNSNSRGGGYVGINTIS